MQIKNYILYSAVAATMLATSAKAQDNASTEEFKPSGKLWGYTFGDYSFKVKTDSAGRNSKNTQYSGTTKDAKGNVVPTMPSNQSNFDFRRIYLGYDYNIAPKISSEFLLAYESLSQDPNALVLISPAVGAPSLAQNGNNDLLVDNRKGLYIKAANVKIKDVFPNHDIVVGQAATPSFPMLTEKIWGYRSIERTILDYRYGGSNDMGVTLKGHYMDGRAGYNLMVANGAGPKLEGNIFKKFYGDVFYYIIDKKLVVDFYADYERSALQGSQSPYTGGTVGSSAPVEKSISTYKAFVAYTTPKLTLGVETYIQNIQNGAKFLKTGETAPDFQSLSVFGLSVYAHATVIENKLRAFARYDIYNPNTKYSDIDQTTFTKDAKGNPTTTLVNAGLLNAYNTPGNMITTETFLTAGLDYTPHANVHFMPNVWYNSYKDQVSGPSGSKASSGDLVYRMTFYYTFGK